MKNYASLLPDVRNNLPGLEIAGKVIDAALTAADPGKAVRANLELREETLIVGRTDYSLAQGAKLVLIALGKAAPAMTAAVLAMAGSRVDRGVCICKHFNEEFQPVPQVHIIVGNHPVPGDGSLEAGKAIREVLSGLGSNDVVLLLLSGGGSSLATLPAEGISLPDMQILTSVLLRSGATINEINTVRKHLDLVKGGGVLRLAAPARVASLVLSDVVGNPLDVIASGPAVADPTTFVQALQIVKKADKLGNIPAGIREYLEKGSLGLIRETVKPGEKESRLGENTIIGSNQVSCDAAAEAARLFGMRADVLSTSLTGEAREVGATLADLARVHKDDARPFVLILGGETTVTIKGNGKGGRNLEVALGAIEEFAGLKDLFLVTCGTDGEDGTSGAAGALVDGESWQRATTAGLDPKAFLEENNSIGFFQKMGDLLVTGPSGTNVNDINFIFGM